MNSCLQNQETTTNSLLIETELDVRIITEFIALCVDGWVEGGKIRGNLLSYSIEESGDLCNLSLTATLEAHLIDDAAVELLNLTLGLHSLGAKIKIEDNRFLNIEKLREALAWMARNSQEKPKPDHVIHAQSHLTLEDLLQINCYLSEQTKPIAELERDADFNRAFPLVDLYNGSYGNIRHRSGHEIFMNWIENKVPGRHRLDAPNPGAEAYKQFDCQLTGKTYRRPKATIKESGPYRKSVQNRRKLAYMLGGVPDEHKARVYAWVVDVLNTVYYYHDTKGSEPLPELFSIDFADCRMTATHDVAFRLHTN